MKSFSGMRNQAGSLAINNSSTNLTLMDELINDSLRNIYAMGDWDFLEKTATASTVASQQFYTLPFDYSKLKGVTVTIGNFIYTPKEVPNREIWDRLNESSTTSDIPEFFFVFNGQLGFFPKPASSTASAITYIYRRQAPDLNIADFTTGNVTALTSGSTTVTGTATSWTVPMAGRFMRITRTSTAAATGDGMWYEIASVGSSTSITLSKAYNGTTISGATAYIIGQMSFLPEEHQNLPVYWALQIYFTSVQSEPVRAQMYAKLYEQGIERLKADHLDKTHNVVVEDLHVGFINPNTHITL